MLDMVVYTKRESERRPKDEAKRAFERKSKPKPKNASILCIKSLYVGVLIVVLNWKELIM